LTNKEKEALSLVAEAFVSATDAQVSFLLQEGSIDDFDNTKMTPLRVI